MAAGSMLFCVAGCDSSARLWDDQVTTEASSSQQMPNPVIDYATYDELSAALGYPMVQLSYVGLEPTTYASIDDKLGEIFYEAGDGSASVLLREQRGVNEDISGIYGATFEQRDIDGTQVNIGQNTDTAVAWFTLGGSSYSISAQDIEMADFEKLVENVVATATAEQAS